MILGSTAHGTPHDLSAGELYARQIDMPAGGAHLAAVSALIDGQGPGAASGAATVYPAVYDEAGDLLTVGAGVVIAAGAPVAWRTLRLDVAGLALAGAPWIGLRAAGADNAARLYGVAPGTADAVTAAAVGDAPATLDAAVASTLEAALLADVFAAYTAPVVEDAALARLPWSLAQRFLGVTGAIGSTGQTAVAGWHGSTTDPEQGASCIVRTDGPLAELVGERVLVTARLGTLRRSVALYCHDEQDFGPDAADEDISLSRRAFQSLAPLATDALTVEIEVLA